MSRQGLVSLGVAVCLAAGATWAASLETAATPKEDDTTVARGQYLVERVGLCQDCHTPRNPQGEYVREQWLQGAPIGFKPIAPMPWAEVALPIAGLPTMNHDEAVHFMMTGERPDGSRPRPPHPEYRFNQEDAEAVVAYLKSLAPAP